MYQLCLFSSSCLENCGGLKATPLQATTLKLDMNFDDTAFAHMLKDYAVFSFILRVAFRNETKGELCNLELVCFHFVVQT